MTIEAFSYHHVKRLALEANKAFSDLDWAKLSDLLAPDFTWGYISLDGLEDKRISHQKAHFLEAWKQGQVHYRVERSIVSEIHVNRQEDRFIAKARAQELRYDLVTDQLLVKALYEDESFYSEIDGQLLMTCLNMKLLENEGSLQSMHVSFS